VIKKLTPLKKLMRNCAYENSGKQEFQYAIELRLFDDQIVFN